MNSPSYAQRLKRIIPIILKEETHYSELQDVLTEFKSLCEAMSGLDFKTDQSNTPIYLDSGKAIGPKWAAACIDDIMRTKRFMRGVHKAVEIARKGKNENPVHLLYTGTGPFATLVLPLLTLYTPEEVKFTLVEINPISYKSVQRVFKELEAEDYIEEIRKENASDIVFEDPNKFDIIIIECLQHALSREPQVAITHNLISQAREDVILIPENISLYFTLINSVKEKEYLMNVAEKKEVDYMSFSEVVFELNKTTMKTYSEPLPSDFKFPRTQTVFTEHELINSDVLAITTEIHIYGGEQLSFRESGLTVPLMIKRLKEGKPIKGVFSEYVLGGSPELDFKFIE